MHFYLRATTVKAAKLEAKREHPEGGIIYGCINIEDTYAIAYVCVIMPRSIPGKRICRSDRHDPDNLRYPRPDYFQFVENSYD